MTFSIIIPMYNEEPVIEETYRRLRSVMEDMGESYELVFVNDGSRDRSAQIVEDLSKGDPTVRLVDFARNFGHQVATTAGIDHATGDALVIIDADLQDPPECIPAMAAKWREGFDVVYGKRKARKGETFAKKVTSWAFYRFLNWMTGQPIPADTGDFRLISRRAADAFRRMPEHQRFLRGMFTWVGFRQCALEFDRDKRWAGETKYPLRAMLKLAFNGIYAFSVKPLKMVTGLGALCAIGGAGWLVTLLILLLCGKAGLGLSAIAAMGLLLSGMLILCMGVLGEYIGRIYEETQRRPLYLVARTLGFEQKEDTCR